MPLSDEMRIDSFEALKKRYKKLTPLQIKLLDAVNTEAANYGDNRVGVRLKAQSEEVLKLLDSQLRKPFDESLLTDVAKSIYFILQEQMDRETEENRRKHRAQGHFDQKFIHQRNIRDELQDHDMTLLMPKSHGDIDVQVILNRFDSGSINASQEGLALALKDEKIKHIVIPIGPGHWRGIYLTKPADASGKYKLELFDPYGPSGAKAIKEITLEMLKKCGINEAQITIELTGPLIPQQDGYACGDFTYAYSHKKMKEWGALKTGYNQQIITVLDTQGNNDGALRQASREESKKQKGSGHILKQTPFTENEKQEFLRRLDQILLDPNQIDKAVFDGKFVKIKSTSRSESYLSLRELDAYGVFNADGSINKAIATQYGITFDENRIRTRLKSKFNKLLSLREMLVLESALSAVEQEYTKSNRPSMGLAKEGLEYFWPNNSFKLLKNPLSMELSGPARNMFGMGYFKFEDTNISISPGPKAAKSLTNPQAPESYELDQDIAGYLNHLLHNNITHVFAMGRVLPYYPQDGLSEDRTIAKGQIIDDFYNYFIPDVNGNVILPDIPELKNLHVTSIPINKVGRFITYEISINGNKPIQVHHFPIRDKQPLELTEEELAYVKEIGQLPEQNIHTHCRGGKGRSAQIAYILASLNEKYSKLTPEKRLAAMRAEKTPDHNKSFVETDIQERHIARIEPSIQQDSSSASVRKDEHFEIYIIYGTLLKQELDKHPQQIGKQDKTPVTKDNKALVELMEKYQELSATPLDQLDNWVKDVCESPLISESTKALLQSVNANNNSTDFLLKAFEARRNPQELGLFFDLQARNRGYEQTIELFNIKRDELLEKLDGSTEEGKYSIAELKQYASLFIAHLQDGYLNNWNNLEEQSEKLALKIDIHANISEKINGIFDALIKTSLTREQFDQLQKEYTQWKPHLELLEKVEGQHEDKLDSYVIQRSKFIEQLFILGYDYFEIEPSKIIYTMNLLYQQLGDLRAANKLTQEKWNELNKQFTALKTIHGLSESEVTPGIISTLDKLFQGNREQIAPLFQVEVLQVKPRGENLGEFVTGLGLVILEAAYDKLPQEFYGDSAKGVYAKEITQLIEAINTLADSKRQSFEKEILLRPPTDKDYEMARQEVLQLIAKHIPTPFLISTNVTAPVENLEKKEEPPVVSSMDEHRKSIEQAKDVRNQAHKKLKEHFAKYKEKYKHLSDQAEEVVNELTASPDMEEEQPPVPPLSESMEDVLKVKAMREATKSGDARRIQDEIDYVTSSIEKKSKKTNPFPKVPKLIVFDIDETLLDLHTNKLKREQELINILNYAKIHNIEVAIATNRTIDLDIHDDVSVETIKKQIRETTGIDIPDALTFLAFTSLTDETNAIYLALKEKIDKLQQEIKLLEPTELNEEKLKNLKQEIDSLQQRSDRLIRGKFRHLDSLRKYYHALKNQDYYQRVEGAILEDFQNPRLTKEIGISDFIEKDKTWAKLFGLAKRLMDSAKEPKPSLQTILKDLIFDTDKSRLFKKYGFDPTKQSEAIEKAVEEEVQEIIANKEYFIQHLPQIESFYRSRLTFRKYEFEKTAVLNEEDVLFLDDLSANVEPTIQFSNYRAIKVSEKGDTSIRYMVEFNYEIGAYNGVIEYLIAEPSEEKEKKIKDYSPKLNNDLIPNFTTYEFRHSPIVLTVKMSTIFAKLPGLSKDETVQKRYKEQFFESALEHYMDLPKELQDDFVTTYYRDAHQTLKAIEQELQKLIQSPPQDPNQLREALSKLKAQIDEVITRDKKFSQRISPTFIDSEANLLRFMIVTYSGNPNSLIVKEDNTVQFKEVHDNARAVFYTESIKRLDNHFNLQEVHSALKKIDDFDKEFIAKQYADLVSKQLQEAMDTNIKDDFPSPVLLAAVAEKKYPSLSSLLDIFEADVNIIDLKNSDFIKIHSQLVAAEKLCDALKQITPRQNMAEDLNGEPRIDYDEKLTVLSEQITKQKQEIESSEQYKARNFLDEAERYIRAKDWNVGLQWTSHTIEVDGKKKKIPATVAEQLNVIEQARKDKDYVSAKKEFIKLGEEKEISYNSSKTARNYYSLFKNKNVAPEKNLENEFSPKKT
ncbi:hypothetical protein [Legionella sp. WA2022007384]